MPFPERMRLIRIFLFYPKDVNKFYLLGGVLGIIITVTVMLGIGKLSPTVAISIILISQLFVAALIDAFGLMGSEKVAFTWNKYIGYGLMIAIGVLAAYFSATYRSKKYALDPDKVFYVTVWAVIGGFGGAKLLYLITQLPAILKDPSLLKDARNGFVFYA